MKRAKVWNFRDCILSSMCRLLLVRAAGEFSIPERLKGLAEISRGSKGFQGHGWGCAYLEEDQWRFYKNIKPIWEDDLSQFGKTTLLLGHARSAFKDEGIEVENNMPFHDGRCVFIFIKRFDRGDLLEALKKGVEIIQKRTQYVRAMNIILTDKKAVCVASVFNEDPEYFTLHYRQTPDQLVICSERLAPDGGWAKIDNNTIRSFR